MRIAGLSKNELSILNAIGVQKKVTTQLLIQQTGLKRSCIQRLLTRLNLYGLIDMDIVVSNGKSNNAFTMTKEGHQTIAQQIVQETNAEAPEKPIEARSTLTEEIRSQSVKNPQIVSWLRSMALSFTVMADQLEAKA